MRQEDLFSSADDNLIITLDDAPSLINLNRLSLVYIRHFLDETHANDALRSLYTELDWQQPTIRIAGQPRVIPRKQVWLGDQAFSYTYSGQQFTATLWHPMARLIKTKIESKLPYQFNSALCNLYRDGQDSVAWHADDEPELGPDPVIAAYSLGQTRRFQLRSRTDATITYQLQLEHNSLLVMGAGVQAQWWHQVPKSAKPMGHRISLTFRKIERAG